MHLPRYTRRFRDSHEKSKEHLVRFSLLGDASTLAVTAESGHPHPERRLLKASLGNVISGAFYANPINRTFFNHHVFENFFLTYCVAYGNRLTHRRRFSRRIIYLFCLWSSWFWHTQSLYKRDALYSTVTSFLQKSGKSGNLVNPDLIRTLRPGFLINLLGNSTVSHVKLFRVKKLLHQSLHCIFRFNHPYALYRLLYDLDVDTEFKQIIVLLKPGSTLKQDMAAKLAALQAGEPPIGNKRNLTATLIRLWYYSS